MIDNRKRRDKYKVMIFIGLISLIVYSIGLVLYLSEPKYIDNCDRPMEQYDYVSIPDYNYGYGFDRKLEVTNGIVVQLDKAHALIER
jgi:hypothetical protein